MIRGAIVALKSGLVIASYGIENVELISPLISATIGIAEEVGTGAPKKLMYEDQEIHVTMPPGNPKVLIIIIADADDPSAPFVVKRLAAAVGKVVPPDVEVVTDELSSAVQEILNALFGTERHLPSILGLSKIAYALYSYLLEERRREFEEEMEEFSAKEIKDEEKKRLKLKKVKGVKNLKKAVRECAKKFYSWDLYKAFEIARQIAASKKWSDIGSLLAAKIGSLLLQLPPNYSTPEFKEVEGLLKEEYSLDEKLVNFVKLQVYAITRGWRDEFRRYISENAEALAEILDNAPEDLGDLYAMLYFVQSRTIFRTPLGDEIVNFLLGRSDVLYRLLLSERNTTKLYDLLFSSKKWDEIRAEVNQYRINYRKTKVKRERLGTAEMLVAEKGFEGLIERVAALREYLLSVLVAFESYGLSAKEREKLLNEAYQEATEDVLEILNSRPPMLSRIYYDLYQSLLYVMYYLTYFKTHQAAVWLWRDMMDTAREGMSLFMSYLIRGRMTKFQFVNYASPMAYMMGKSSLRTNEFPMELAFYAKVLSELDKETIKHIDGQVADERILILTHSIIGLAGLARLVPINLRAAVLRALLYFLDSIGEWGVLNAKISREFVDDFADVLALLIEVDLDPDWILMYLEKAKMYADIIIGVEEENSFEAAVLYERIYKLATKFIERFGESPGVEEIAQYTFSRAKEIWLAEGYPAKAKELERIAEEVRKTSSLHQSPHAGLSSSE